MSVISLRSGTLAKVYAAKARNYKCPQQTLPSAHSHLFGGEGKGRASRYRMVVGFKITYAYNH